VFAGFDCVLQRNPLSFSCTSAATMASNGGEEKAKKRKGWKDLKDVSSDGDGSSGAHVGAISSDLLKDLPEDEMEEAEDVLVADGEAEKRELEGENDEKAKNEEGARCLVKICNLVRPYTLGQLKALLARTGEIEEDSLVLNAVKSEAVVAYTNAEEAEETVSALEGVRWPQDSPKTLSVSRATEAEWSALKGGAKSVSEARKRKASESVPEGPEAPPEIHKRRVDHQHSVSREEEERKRPEREKPKSLEELFQATKTPPVLYWKKNDAVTTTSA